MAGSPYFPGKVEFVGVGGSKVVGGLIIQKKDENVVIIQGTVSYLPVGKHAFHIQTHSSITNDCNDVGGHFNPANVGIL